jgi:hypothetical protein
MEFEPNLKTNFIRAFSDSVCIQSSGALVTFPVIGAMQTFSARIDRNSISSPQHGSLSLLFLAEWARVDRPLKSDPTLFLPVLVSDQISIPTHPWPLPTMSRSAPHPSSVLGGGCRCGPKASEAKSLGVPIRGNALLS